MFGKKGDLKDLKPHVNMSLESVRTVVLWAEDRGYRVIKNPFAISGVGFLMKTPEGKIVSLELASSILGFLSKRMYFR